MQCSTNAYTHATIACLIITSGRRERINYKLFMYLLFMLVLRLPSGWICSPIHVCVLEPWIRQRSRCIVGYVYLCSLLVRRTSYAVPLCKKQTTAATMCSMNAKIDDRTDTALNRMPDIGMCNVWRVANSTAIVRRSNQMHGHSLFIGTAYKHNIYTWTAVNQSIHFRVVLWSRRILFLWCTVLRVFRLIIVWKKIIVGSSTSFESSSNKSIKFK